MLSLPLKHMCKYHSDIGHCCSQVVVVSKKRFFLLFLIGENRHGIGGKNVPIFDWEWGRNAAPREGQKILCIEMLPMRTQSILENYLSRIQISLAQLGF